MSKYKPYLASEVEDLLDSFEPEFRSFNIANTQEDTITQCHFIMLCMFSIVRGMNTCLTNQQFLPFDILWRSIVDYCCDLAFLAARDNPATNILFARYSDLNGLWLAEKIERSKHAGKVMEIFTGNRVKYAKYISVHGELLKNRGGFPIKKKRGKKELGFDQFLKKIYRQHWSGLGRTERMIVIEKSGIIPDDLPSSLSNAFALFSNYVHPSPWSTQTVLGQEAEPDQLKKFEMGLLSTLCQMMVVFCNLSKDQAGNKLGSLFDSLLIKGKDIRQHTEKLREEQRNHSSE